MGRSDETADAHGLGDPGRRDVARRSDTEARDAVVESRRKRIQSPTIFYTTAALISYAGQVLA